MSHCWVKDGHRASRGSARMAILCMDLAEVQALTEALAPWGWHWPRNKPGEYHWPIVHEETRQRSGSICVHAEEYFVPRQLEFDTEEATVRTGQTLIPFPVAMEYIQGISSPAASAASGRHLSSSKGSPNSPDVSPAGRGVEPCLHASTKPVWISHSVGWVSVCCNPDCLKEV